ncbi:hypothetical protein [Streptomyces sp. NPDC056468]
MHFSDGGIGRYDVVVGADGIWSTSRRDRTRSMPTTLRGDLP